MNTEMLNISHRVPQIKANKLRREGYIPGVLYSNNQDSIPVIFDKKRAESFVHHNGYSAIFEISLEGEIKPVRIREVQRDPITHEIIHMDLQNIHMNKTIQATVPLRFEGVHDVEKRGLILQHQKNTIDVEGLARDIPPYIKVSVNMFNNKNSIRVYDLEVAQELSIVDSPEEIIALVIKPSREEETDVQPAKESERAGQPQGEK